MDAYIDFTNFCSYLSSMSDKDFDKCNEVLLNAFNLCFTFDKSEMQNVNKKIRQNFGLWLRTATTNRNGKNNNWNVNFPPRPVDKSSHNTFSKDKLSSIYMLDGEDVKEWAETGSLLVGEKGKELDVIRKLQISKSFIPTKQFRIRSMSDWSTIRDNSTPCTDIIIVDQYLFSQSEYEYEINSYSVIGNLCRWAHSAAINIVIFTLNDYKECDHRQNIPFVTIERQLKQRLLQQIGVEPNITFVILPRQEQHDRTIFTNYKMYTSGDSFKYFRDGSNVSLCTHGEWMYVSSLHDDDNFQNAQDFINDLQVIIDNVKNGVSSVKGDRKSFFLTF